MRGDAPLIGLWLVWPALVVLAIWINRRFGRDE